jgi:hypothetical protein
MPPSHVERGAEAGIDQYFSDVFRVKPQIIEQHGAFNISLLSDLPLFIDPFLLFNSRKPKYRKLHDQIIAYLRFLRDKATSGQLAPGLMGAWYRFPEAKQIWLGFSKAGNRGCGLGKDFGAALHANLNRIFSDFGSETVTRSSHLEKLCLIEEGVGRDKISDFTTNLVREFLVEYTQSFAQLHIAPELRKDVAVNKVRFNYSTETWEGGRYDLPWYLGDYVLLTPKDILTRDDTWINKTDLVREFERIPESIPNEQLRAQVNNYFLKALPKQPTRKDEARAAISTVLQFPEVIEFYIRYKEENGERATSVSAEKVAYSQRLYVEQFKRLGEMLAQTTGFYGLTGNTYEESHQRIAFLKDVIENKGGHRIFYVGGRPIEREEDLHILYRLTWFATVSDVSREANDGRGPVDFKVSRGSRDKTLVEFKLAKNSQLKRNLERQVPIYERASDATKSIKVILYFSPYELQRVNDILGQLKIVGHRDIVLIDARRDNKPPGSKA